MPGLTAISSWGLCLRGIYCRPICRAKFPRPGNCTYYATAAEAERAGFRPCLGWRPWGSMPPLIYGIH
ncbi:hypothetical protein HHJ06_10995 [Akkermansia muciniphila]|nr:hypothetical protein [Akkermansia muciniphila]